MPVTLQQIAEHLELSKATVSRSLRNDPQILPKTRAKVHAAAVRMGYEGRPRRSRLQKRGANSERQSTPAARGTLGFLFPAASLDRASQDINFVRIMQGAVTEAEHGGMPLMIHTILPGARERMDENPAQVPAMIREHACRAVMLWGALQDADVAFLAARVPVVTIGRIYPDSHTDAVVQDNLNGLRTLVTRLVELGHRRLAWVGGHYQASFLDERQAGFMTGCLQNGLDLSLQKFLGEEIYENRRVHAQSTLLQVMQEGASAFVCANDAIAQQVIEVLERGSLRIPHDVSVTGFDALPPLDDGRTITSIDPNFTEQGRTAVWLAGKRMTQSSSSPYILTVRGEFVPGDTVATPPNRTQSR